MQLELPMTSLSLDRARTADGHQLAQQRRSDLARGAAKIELFDAVLRLARRTANRAVSDHLAIDSA